MKPYKALSFALAAAVLCALAACGRGNDIASSSQVLARVGDKEITATALDRQVNTLPESMRGFATQGQGRRALLEGLVNRELLFAEAVRKKFDKDADLERKYEDIKKELVIAAYLDKEISAKVAVDDKEVQDYYSNHPGEFRNREEIRIGQIVAADEKKADELMSQLRSRADFGDLATRHSTEKVSAARKGDAGFFTYNRLPEEVRDKVFKVKVGEISGPHKTKDGYEIYKITDRKTASYSFEQSKDAIRMQIQSDKYQKALKALTDELKKTTTVQINEALLK